MSQAKHHGGVVGPDARWEVKIVVGQHGSDKREGCALLKLLWGAKSINPSGSSKRKADFRGSGSRGWQLRLERIGIRYWQARCSWTSAARCLLDFRYPGKHGLGLG